MKQLFFIIILTLSVITTHAQCPCEKVVQNDLDLYILCDGFLELTNKDTSSYAVLGSSSLGEHYFLHLLVSFKDSAQAINSMLSLTLEGEGFAGAILVQRDIFPQKKQASGLFSLTKYELQKISASKIKSLNFNLMDGTTLSYTSSYTSNKKLADLASQIECMDKIQVITAQDSINAKENNEKSIDASLKGDTKLAIEYVDKAIKQNPKQLDYFISKASFIADLGNYQEAYDFYSRIIEKHPNYSNTYDFRAGLFRSLGQPLDAILDYNKAIQLAENDSYKALYLNNRANAKAQVKDLQGSYEDLKLSLELSPNRVGALNNMANTCSELGKIDEAMSCFKKALALDSLFDGSYINLGFFLQSQNKDKEAIQYFNKAIHLNQNSEYAYSNRSLSLFKIGKTDEALKDINRSLELNNKNPYAYWVRASIYLKKGKKVNACPDLDKALEYGYSEYYGNEVERLKKENCHK